MYSMPCTYPAIPKAELTHEERRELRRLRRDKQHANNVPRAAKMHKAGLKAQKPKQPQPLKQSVYVACSRWHHW